MHKRVADVSAREFFDQIADPDVFCGGGSVAALTAAGAASTVLLVLRLNVKRRANAAVRDDIERAIDDTKAARDAFYEAADEDIAILGRLLDAQRALKSGGSRDEFRMALTNAAESPLRMSERIATFLDDIAAQLAISSRFTISDLGAAAVLAEGACRAALLTAEVNIVLLREEPDADQLTVQSLEDRRTAIRARVVERSNQIEALTSSIMLGNKEKK